MYTAKTAASRSASDNRNGNQGLEVGDMVDVPGGMHGTIRFIGEVRGKAGIFAGVELSKEWAARGKNDGDVDGYDSDTRSLVAKCLHNGAGRDTSPHQSKGPAYSFLPVKLTNDSHLSFHKAPPLRHPQLRPSRPSIKAAAQSRSRILCQRPH